MAGELQLDDHKLRYHPQSIADFLAGRPIIPINAEISLTGACNHRCLFCNFDYLGHRPISLPEGRAPALAAEMAHAGVKAVTFAGSGEPSLHPDLLPSLRAAVAGGMAAALSTNGVPLRPEQLDEMPGLLTWVRFSVNGGTPRQYAAVHQCRESDFGAAMRNIARLADAKRRAGSAMTLGTQCVLTEENRDDIRTLAERLREAGADYFAVKHFYPREEGGYRPDMSFRTGAFLDDLAGMAKELSGGAFSMIVRDAGKLERRRPYARCLGLPFIVYCRENGLLYTCFSHQEDERTAVGSILEHDFATLWNSAGREESIRRIDEQYDKNACQANCRHHQINLWLWGLAHPPPHVNFI